MRARDGGGDEAWGRGVGEGLDTNEDTPDESNGAENNERWQQAGRGSGGLLPGDDDGAVPGGRRGGANGRGRWRDSGYDTAGGGYNDNAAVTDGAERRGGGRQGQGRAWNERGGGGGRDSGPEDGENAIGDFYDVRPSFAQSQRGGGGGASTGNNGSGGLVDRSAEHSSGSWLPGPGASESYFSNASSGSGRTGSGTSSGGGMMNVDTSRGLASITTAEEAFTTLGRPQQHHSGSVNAPASASPATGLYGGGGGGTGGARDRNGWDAREWTELGAAAAAAATVARGEASMSTRGDGVDDRFSSRPYYAYYYGNVGSTAAAGGGVSGKGGYATALPLPSGGDVVREHASGNGLELGHGVLGSGTRADDGGSSGRKSPGGFDPNASSSRIFNPGVDSPFQGADDDDGEGVGRWAGSAERGLGLVRTPSDEAASRAGAAHALVEGLAKSVNCGLVGGASGRSSDLPRRGGQHHQPRPEFCDSYKSMDTVGGASSGEADHGRGGEAANQLPKASAWPNSEDGGNGRFAATVVSAGEAPRSVASSYGERSAAWANVGTNTCGVSSQSARVPRSTQDSFVESNPRVASTLVGDGARGSASSNANNDGDPERSEDRSGDLSAKRNEAGSAAMLPEGNERTERVRKAGVGQQAQRPPSNNRSPLSAVVGTRISGIAGAGVSNCGGGGGTNSNEVDLLVQRGNGSGRETVAGNDGRTGDHGQRSGEGGTVGGGSGSGASQQAVRTTGGGQIVKSYDTLEGISMDRKAAEETARNVLAAAASALQ